MPANLENSAMATGLKRVSFHSNPNEGQLLSFHMLVSDTQNTYFKLGFNSMQTENFQMYRLDLEKADESELPTLVYCHPAYLTYMQRTSCKMPDWMNHKLESRLMGEI